MVNITKDNIKDFEAFVAISQTTLNPIDDTISIVYRVWVNLYGNDANEYYQYNYSIEKINLSELEQDLMDKQHKVNQKLEVIKQQIRDLLKITEYVEVNFQQVITKITQDVF